MFWVCTVPVLMYAVNSAPQRPGRNGLRAHRRPAPPAPAKQSVQLLTRFGGACTAEGTSIASCAAITQTKHFGLLAQRRPAPPALAKQSMQLLSKHGRGRARPKPSHPNRRAAAQPRRPTGQKRTSGLPAYEESTAKQFRTVPEKVRELGTEQKPCVKPRPRTQERAERLRADSENPEGQSAQP